MQGARDGGGAGVVAGADVPPSPTDLQAACPTAVAELMLACERKTLGRWERIRTHGAIE
jgi:hypothetical protein